jgi:hypothetical protein
MLSQSTDSPVRVAFGKTPPGATAWQQDPGGCGVFVDVDTSPGMFSSVPIYLSSLEGEAAHWATTGATSIYSAVANSFRVYVRWAGGSSLTPQQANEFKWHINWVAIGT